VALAGLAIWPDFSDCTGGVQRPISDAAGNAGKRLRFAQFLGAVRPVRAEQIPIFPVVRFNRGVDSWGTTAAAVTARKTDSCDSIHPNLVLLT